MKSEGASTPKRRALLDALTAAQTRAGYMGAGRAGTTALQPGLSDLLGLGPATLSETGQAALDLAEHLDEEMPGLNAGQTWRDLVWRVAAWHELVYVFDVRFAPDDAAPDLLRQHHCYWETYALLREQLVAILNGQLSLWATSLRPFLELTVAEAYFHLASAPVELREWLDGAAEPPRWGQMIRFLERNERFTQAPRVLRRLHAGYAAACGYAHKPDASSSLLGARGTNEGYGNLETFFRVITEQALLLQTGLAVLVLTYPGVLVPLDPIAKFGFDGPVGLYVGDYEVQTCRLALGDDDFTALQALARNDPDVVALISSYEAQPDQTPEEIERSARDRRRVTGFDERDLALPFEQRLLKWTAAHKAWLFAMHLNLNYVAARQATVDGREIDVDELTRLFPRRRH